MKSILKKNHSFGNVFFDVGRIISFFRIIVIIIFTFIKSSCTTTSAQSMKQKVDTFTGKLSILDSVLDSFAKTHQTEVLFTKSTYYPPVEISLENREISWIHGPIAKAILIRPYSTNLGPVPDAWDFQIIAWIIEAPTQEKPFREFYLLRNAGIETLKIRIEDLLNQAEQKLKEIKLEDLK
jgi:hypothetical protein